jgi:hypothetical protein
LQLPVVYVVHAGTQFDGHHAYTFDNSRTAHLPELSAAFGVRPAVGALFERVLSGVDAAATISVEWSHHPARGFNAGDIPYNREAANLYNGSLQLRAILAVWSVKPFVDLSPGYGWLSLPRGVTIVEPQTRNTTWSDLTLRGLTFETALGAMLAIVPALSVEVAIGYRLHGYTASTAGAVSNLGLSPGLVASLGVAASL